jgi:hypothetical protein
MKKRNRNFSESAFHVALVRHAFLTAVCLAVWRGVTPFRPVTIPFIKIFEMALE